MHAHALVTRFLTRTTALLAVLFFLPTAIAQNQFDLSELDDGELILNLSATEMVSVVQDTLNVSMRYTAQGRDTTDLQDEVNEIMREAMNILEDTNNIDYSIEQYHVYNVPGRPNSRNDLENPVWRAQQGIQMQSMNSEALLVVTARLQEAGLIINNLNYSLSSEKYEEISDSLMGAALVKLQARADEIADILNKDEANLIEVNINGGQQGFFENRSAMAMSARAADSAMAVPVAEPGETRVNMTVSARALLKD